MYSEPLHLDLCQQPSDSELVLGKQVSCLCSTSVCSVTRVCYMYSEPLHLDLCQQPSDSELVLGKQVSCLCSTSVCSVTRCVLYVQ